MTNWAITSRDNSTTSTGVTSMNFQTGFFRFAMYCQQYPYNGTVWWQIDDLLHGTGCAGTVTANLPAGGTTMRAVAALCNWSGIKAFNTSVVYVETLGTPLD